MGTIETPPAKRLKIQKVRSPGDNASSFSVIPATANWKCAQPIQRRKTKTPKAGPRQLQCQSSALKLRRYRTSIQTPAATRSGYRNSKSLDRARATAAAARMASNGMRYAAVGLWVAADVADGVAARFSQELRRLMSTTAQATALKAIQPAWE